MLIYINIFIMKMFSLLNIMMTINLVSSLYNNFFLKTINANRMRSFLNIKTNENYKQLSYQNAKQILKNMPVIDIYGDTKEPLNAEHIFPQFSFKNDARKNMMKSDLHNLYLCNSKLNNARQNFKYIDPDFYEIGENDKVLDTSGKKIDFQNNFFNKRGFLMVSNYKNRTFIPSDYSQGKVARSLAYFGVKYNYINELNKIIDYKTLLEWNLKDPVSEEEYLKNIICYKHQKNLNPFVVDNDLMLYCFSDLVNIDDDLLSLKKERSVDPLHSIEYLLKDIEKLESNNNRYEDFIKKHLKKNKEFDFKKIL